VLKVRGTLDAQQVRAIRHLVASAVNGLKPQRVSIVDEAGRLLADGSGNDDLGEVSADERRTSFEKRLSAQVDAIVSSVVGPGRARIQVSADFDFNRITETSDKYDPEGRVVRSSQTREELSASETRDNQVTVGNEIPGNNQQRPGAAAPDGNAPPRDQNRKSEEIVNYEISKTTKTEVTEGGRVNRISVAVLVDGVYGKNDSGDVVYEPRTKEEIEQIAALVRTAIGFDQKRGDQVEVVNLRFAETPATPISAPDGWLAGLQFTKDDIMRAIEMGVMGLLGLVVLLMVVRPLVRRMLASDVPAVAALPAGGAQLTDVLAAVESIKAEPSETARKIDIAQIQGQVHAQSVQKVGELADRNPSEAVSIIRQWMTETHAS
jgi:flagellar M-ring protein FliF